MSLTAELARLPRWGAVFDPDQMIIESNPDRSNFGAGRLATRASMAKRWRFASKTWNDRGVCYRDKPFIL